MQGRCEGNPTREERWRERGNEEGGRGVSEGGRGGSEGVWGGGGGVVGWEGGEWGEVGREGEVWDVVVEDEWLQFMRLVCLD